MGWVTALDAVPTRFMLPKGNRESPSEVSHRTASGRKELAPRSLEIDLESGGDPQAAGARGTASF